MNVLWVDVETTGLDAIQNDIVTLSGLIEIDGVIKEEFDFTMQPFRYDTISQQALDTNKLTIEQIKAFPDPRTVYPKFKSILTKYVDPYKKNKTQDDKFMLAGYNVKFDSDFITSWANKCEDKYFGALVTYYRLDIAAIVLFLKYHNLLTFPGYKLVDVGKFLGIDFQAHDAKADIKTTYQICQQLLKHLEVKK